MNIVGPLMQFQQQIRLFHWQTSSYAQHKAFGHAYEELDELIDTFIETFMGKFGRIKPTMTYNLELVPLTSTEVSSQVIKDFEQYLNSMNQADLPTDLLNIRDSILGEVHHLSYMLSLT